MEKKKIWIDKVDKVYQNKQGAERLALKEVSLEIAAGEFVCLLGSSGCGKSTLLNLMAGFDQPTRGSINLDGLTVQKPNPRFVTLFQDYGLFPWRTVQQNVEFGLEAQGLDKRERAALARKFIDLVGLGNFVHSHPGELSGGMKQRVALARALAVDPEVLFMDEPFGALDAITRIKMQEETVRLWQEKKRTIVFVTHDIDEAIYLADRIVIMSAHPGQVKTVLPVRMGRPRDRTGYDFGRIRDLVFKEFELKASQEPEYVL